MSNPAPRKDSADPAHTEDYPPLRTIYIEATEDGLHSDAAISERSDLVSYSEGASLGLSTRAGEVKVRIKPGLAYWPIMLGWTVYDASNTELSTGSNLLTTAFAGNTFAAEPSGNYTAAFRIYRRV